MSALPHHQMAITLRDPDFIAAVMRAWDQKLDTVAISLRLFGTADEEGTVSRALQIGRERRRAASPQVGETA